MQAETKLSSLELETRDPDVSYYLIAEVVNRLGGFNDPRNNWFSHTQLGNGLWKLEVRDAGDDELYATVAELSLDPPRFQVGISPKYAEYKDLIEEEVRKQLGLPPR